MIVPHSRPMIDTWDIRAVSEVLGSCMIAQGEKVSEFEDKIAAFVGVKYAAAVSSGTTALHLALASLGIKKGDEVIMPSYVCSSPYMATIHAGATPRVVDIEISDFNISIQATRKNVTSKTKAIIVPHMFGNPVELDEFLELGIPIVEDCAHALGAEYKGRMVGSLGSAAIFSFYATKMMTTGEGGMVLTDDPQVFHSVKELREYDGRSLDITRYNYKMTDLEAALGLSQLHKLGYFIERRRQIASLYSERLNACDFEVTRPKLYSYKRPIFYRYILLTEKLDQLQSLMRASGIMCERPVSFPLHKCISSLACPNTDYVFQRALSVPLYPSMTNEEVDRVIKCLESAFQLL